MLAVHHVTYSSKLFSSLLFLPFFLFSLFSLTSAFHIAFTNLRPLIRGGISSFFTPATMLSCLVKPAHLCCNVDPGNLIYVGQNKKDMKFRQHEKECLSSEC